MPQRPANTETKKYLDGQYAMRVMDIADTLRGLANDVESYGAPGYPDMTGNATRIMSMIHNMQAQIPLGGLISVAAEIDHDDKVTPRH